MSYIRLKWPVFENDRCQELINGYFCYLLYLVFILVLSISCALHYFLLRMTLITVVALTWLEPVNRMALHESSTNQFSFLLFIFAEKLCKFWIWGSQVYRSSTAKNFINFKKISWISNWCLSTRTQQWVKIWKTR